MHDDLRQAAGIELGPGHEAAAEAAPAAAAATAAVLPRSPEALGHGGRRRGARWVIFAVGTAALAAAGWWQFHRPAHTDAPAATASPRTGGRYAAMAGRAQPVSIAPVELRDVPVVAGAIGSITAANTAVVRAKVSGELKAIRFTEGKPVRAGEVIAQIDPRPFEIAVAQAQAQLARDQAQLANARLDLTRYQDLVAKDAAPKQQLDTQEALVQQLAGTVQADQSALDNARLQLSYTQVLAPISGLAGLKQADLGNVVNPADPNGLLSIAQMQPAAVVFAVPEAQLPLIRQRLQAGQPLPVQAWDRAQKVRLAEGRVASTDNAIDPTTGTIKLKALFPNADNALFPNQFVNVRLQLDTVHQTLSVPTAALQRGAPGTFVYAVADDSTVMLRRVTVTTTDGDRAAVQGDLKAGDRVVVDGADRLRDGAKVEVIVPGAAARGGSATAGAAAASAAHGDHARWMDRVPPEMLDKLKAMSDDERRAWLRQQREQRGTAPGPAN